MLAIKNIEANKQELAHTMYNNAIYFLPVFITKITKKL